MIQPVKTKKGNHHQQKTVQVIQKINPKTKIETALQQMPAGHLTKKRMNIGQAFDQTVFVDPSDALDVVGFIVRQIGGYRRLHQCSDSDETKNQFCKSSPILEILERLFEKNSDFFSVN